MRTKDLAPNPKNPRKITDEKLQMLKRAMLEFGDLSGIVFNRKSGQLVGGHQRTTWMDPNAEVVISKKYSKPTKTGTVAEGYLELDGERFAYREVSWDKHREMAANIAANKGAGEWDMPELTLWMKELSSFDADDFDMGLTMFDEDELEEFGGIIVSEHTRTGATGVDEDEIPEKAPPRTQIGNIYQLGDHRLMCGDSTDFEQIKILMNGTKPSMVYTDPPYGIEIVKNSRGNKGVLAKPGKYRDIVGDGSVAVAVEAVKICLDMNVLTVVIWGANYFARALPDSQKWLVWDKLRPAGTTFSDCELAWTNLPGNIKKYEFFWHGMMQEGKREARVHPTQKPVGLHEKILADIGQPTILDLFGGSGSTLIACEKTARKCFMMEIDPAYCDVIVERWEKYTGQKAKLLNPPKRQVVTKLRKKAAAQVSRRNDAHA